MKYHFHKQVLKVLLLVLIISKPVNALNIDVSAMYGGVENNYSIKDKDKQFLTPSIDIYPFSERALKIGIGANYLEMSRISSSLLYEDFEANDPSNVEYDMRVYTAYVNLKYSNDFNENFGYFIQGKAGYTVEGDKRYFETSEQPGFPIDYREISTGYYAGVTAGINSGNLGFALYYDILEVRNTYNSAEFNEFVKVKTVVPNVGFLFRYIYKHDEYEF